MSINLNSYEVITPEQQLYVKYIQGTENSRFVKVIKKTNTMLGYEIICAVVDFGECKNYSDCGIMNYELVMRLWDVTIFLGIDHRKKDKVDFVMVKHFGDEDTTLEVRKVILVHREFSNRQKVQQVLQEHYNELWPNKVNKLPQDMVDTILKNYNNTHFNN